MTDKELFKKINEKFNLKDVTILENTYNAGKYKKVINEIRGPKSPSLPNAPKVSGGGGFLSRIAAAIPGTRGHKIRGAEARTALAAAKKAEVDARFDQQQQMKGIEPPKPGQSSRRNRQSTTKTTPAATTPVAVKFKVGDEVFVKTTKNPKAEGKVTSALDDKPGFVQVVVKGAPPYAYDKRNVTLKRGINKENFEDIVKRYI